MFTAAGYLAVRAFAPQKILNGLTFCVGVTTALVTVLYVLNIFNIDLIGTYADTAVVERAQFFSTLGQKNFCSGFMAFALPLVFYAFLVARGPRHTVFYGIPAFFGGLALAVVDAEGLMLGVGVAALVLICQKNFTTRTLRRLAVIGAFFFFHAGWMQYMRTHVYTQGQPCCKRRCNDFRRSPGTVRSGTVDMQINLHPSAPPSCSGRSCILPSGSPVPAVSDKNVCQINSSK